MLIETEQQHIISDVEKQLAEQGINVDITINKEASKPNMKYCNNVSNIKIKGGRKLKEILANNNRFTDPEDIKPDFWFYAIASRTGYGLYNSINAAKHQMVYFRDVVVREFMYADDAYEWIKATVPELSHIRGHQFKSLDYLLVYKNYWFYSPVKEKE